MMSTMKKVVMKFSNDIVSSITLSKNEDFYIFETEKIE